MKHRQPIIRQGFTLLELLMVIAIIAVLVGLLMPAVHKARSAATRIQCANNIKQIGLALHSYVDTNNVLPPNGTFTFTGTSVVQTSPWSALSRILPYIEQENLFQGIDFTMPYSVQPNISSKRVATYICPAEINDRGSGTDPVYGNKNYTINYAVSLGSWAVLTRKATEMKGADGAFSPNGSYGFERFTDGLSNTLAISEVKSYTTRIAGSVNSQVFLPPPARPNSPLDLSAFSLAAFDPTKQTHVEWVDGKVHETGFTTAFTPNTSVVFTNAAKNYDVDFITATEANLGDTYAAVTSRSFHSGGVNALFMDGSVHFISNNISLTIWRALGTRSGGERIGDDI